MSWKLSRITEQRLRDLHDDLAREEENLRLRYVLRTSQKWKNTQEGIDVDAWLDTLGNLIADLDNFPADTSRPG